MATTAPASDPAAYLADLPPKVATALVQLVRTVAGMSEAEKDVASELLLAAAELTADEGGDDLQSSAALLLATCSLVHELWIRSLSLEGVV